MSVNHCFSVELAEQYGIEAAILIHHFQFWIEQNQAMNRNFHEERTWLYQTQKEIAAIYPYWSEDTVCRIINKLVEAGVLIKGNFNKTSFDRTIWYAFENEKMFTKPRNRGMENANSRNPIHETAETIPDTKTNAKHNNIVVGEKQVSHVKKEKKSELTKDDVYLFALRQKKNWSSPEIEEAWESFAKAKNPITDPMKYIESIVEKKRVLKQNKTRGKSCQTMNKTSQEYSKKECEHIKEDISEKDTLVQILGQFDRPCMHKHKLVTS